MTTLTVDTEAKRLKVAVATESRATGRARWSPPAQGDGRAGKPVRPRSRWRRRRRRPHVIAFKTPDPLATFYAAWGLGVSTASQYERIAGCPSPAKNATPPAATARRAGKLPVAFSRHRVLEPALETDAAGQAKVTFQAPDNLTAYRLMAVAADGGERFGSATADHRAQAAAAAERDAALPERGRRRKAGVLVVNETGKAGRVTVERRCGARVAAARTGRSRFPQAGACRCMFPLRAEQSGEPRLRVTAALGDETRRAGAEDPGPLPGARRDRAGRGGPTPDPAEIPSTCPPASCPRRLAGGVDDPDGVAGIEEGLRDSSNIRTGASNRPRHVSSRWSWSRSSRDRSS